VPQPGEHQQRADGDARGRAAGAPDARRRQLELETHPHASAVELADGGDDAGAARDAIAILDVEAAPDARHEALVAHPLAAAAGAVLEAHELALQEGLEAALHVSGVAADLALEHQQRL